jgi:hypothetical protein
MKVGNTSNYIQIMDFLSSQQYSILRNFWNRTPLHHYILKPHAFTPLHFEAARLYTITFWNRTPLHHYILKPRAFTPLHFETAPLHTNTFWNHPPSYYHTLKPHAFTPLHFETARHHTITPLHFRDSLCLTACRIMEFIFCLVSYPLWFGKLTVQVCVLHLRD